MEITIRPAREKDLPAIHGLVRDLAVYEKAEPEFIASLADYYEDFKAGIFEALVG